MPITYLSHPVRGGVHIAYDSDEVARCEADGWVSHGGVHPAEGGKRQPPQPVAPKSAYEDAPKMPDEPAQPPKKRGPYKKRGK